MNNKTFQERAVEFSKEMEDSILPIVSEKGKIEIEVNGMPCLFELSSDNSTVLVSTSMAKSIKFSDFPITPQVLFADAIIKASQ